MITQKCPHCGKRLPYRTQCECAKKRRNKYMKKRYEEGKVDKALNCKLWRDIRQEVIQRDGGFCQRCFALRGEIVTDNLTVDHIKTRKDYPELVYDKDNLITLCQSCNSEKGEHNYLDFIPPNIREE